MLARMLRFLVCAVLLLGSGCSCSFELFPPDECLSDADCDDGDLCNGLERCTGFFTASCGSFTDPACFGNEVCDPEANMCVDCDFAPDHPLCPPPIDAGPSPDASVDPDTCAALACGLEEECAQLGESPPACYLRCPVGQERDLHLGPRGRGERCPEAFACHSLGDPMEPERGICVLGNYNDVLEPNIGAACLDDRECFSPYGRGRCAHLDERPVGVCEVVDCAGERALWPGVSTRFDVCPAPAVCDLVDSTCRATCEIADDCPVGLGCAGERCVAICTDTSQCRGIERCVNDEATPCTEGDDACRCEPLTVMAP